MATLTIETGDVIEKWKLIIQDNEVEIVHTGKGDTAGQATKDFLIDLITEDFNKGLKENVYPYKNFEKSFQWKII